MPNSGPRNQPLAQLFSAASCAHETDWYAMRQQELGTMCHRSSFTDSSLRGGKCIVGRATPDERISGADAREGVVYKEARSPP